MFFINSTGVIGTILNAGTQSITGSVVASLLLIFILLIVVSLMFQIPIEITSLLYLPFVLALSAYYSDFMSALIVILIIVASLVAKNWLFK